MLWLLGAACCFVHLKVHCPVDKCPIWALVLNSQSQRTDELSTIERGSSCMKGPSFCDWNCLSPSILLSWPNIWQTQSLQRQVLLVCDNMQRQVLLVCDNMQRQVLLVCDYLWQYPSGGLPKHHWPWTCVEKQPFGLIDVPSESVAMEKGNVCNFFSPAALKDGDRQRCIISGRTWHHYSCRDMCALRRLNCAHCANFEHVSPGYQKLCAPVHIPRGCAQYIVQVYITWTLRSICRWSWLNMYLLIAIWCCY